MLSQQLTQTGLSAAQASETQTRYLEAVMMVIKDREEKFDECLVDRLLELQNHTQITSGMLLQQILNWYTDDTNTETNHARLFKLQRLIFQQHSGSPCLNEKIVRATELFCERIPAVSTRDDTREVSACLILVKQLFYTRSTFDMIINKEFRSLHFNDIAQLAKHYLEVGKSYHIKRLGHQLFVELMRKTATSQLPQNHRIIVSVKQILDQSLPSESSSVYRTLVECFKTTPEIDLVYELTPLFGRCFEIAIKDTNHSLLNNLSRCLALTRGDHEYFIDRLRKLNNFESILTYATSCHESVFNQTSMLYFIIYPILLQCDSENAKILTSRLCMATHEKCFVGRFCDHKHVSRCLMYLRRSFPIDTSCINSNTVLGDQKLEPLYFMTVVLEYIKCQHKSQEAYKNLLECCGALGSSLQYLVCQNEFVWLLQMIDELSKIIDIYDNSITVSQRAIVIQLVRLIAEAHRRITVSHTEEFLNKIHVNCLRYIRLAKKFTHLDLLNEFALLFKCNHFRFDISDSDSGTYIDYIYVDLYSKARKHAYHDLLSNIVSTFCYVDCECPRDILKHYGIDKNYTIPRILRKLLLDPSTDDVSIESIFTAIHEPIEPSCQSNSSPVLSTHYLGRLLRECPESISTDLVLLTESICLALLREPGTSTHLPIVNVLFDVASFILDNKEDSIALETLVNMRIIETFFQIHEDSSFSMESRDHICKKISTFKSLNLCCPESESQDHFVELFARVCREVDENDVARQEKAGKLSVFFKKHDGHSCILSSYDTNGQFKENLMSIDTYIDSVLNQEHSSCAILECY